MQYPLSTLRHSAAHILAQAVLRLYPQAKLAIGPSIENGFYYDFDLPEALNEEIFPRLESIMQNIILEKQVFEYFELPIDKARTFLKDQPYKLKLIEKLESSVDSISFYRNGPFVDMCKGPHVESTAQVPCIKLLRVSGAYWSGDESQKMLQRIYGTAFYNKSDLDVFLTQQEEAEKRDHRKLGKSMDLFSIQEDIGPGLCLWHPNGAFLKNQLETMWKEKHLQSNYELVSTPHIGLQNLWEKSGHLGFYSENMYAPIDVEHSNYYVKPMNCPFHIKIYQSQQRSYKELPIRQAELGTVYRQERSGVLHGLFRVRGFTQDDAHIYCLPDQLSSEICSVINLCFDILDLFGFSDLEIYVSTRPTEKSVGSSESWKHAEDALKKALVDLNQPFKIDEGGGAFYGPKIDIKIKDALGRQWQCSTIQVDFNLPKQFDLAYIDSDGAKKQPIMIHRACFGSIERFIAILTEHYNGHFPLWLISKQLIILPLKKELVDYADELKDLLTQQGLRAVVDSSKASLGSKIKRYNQKKVPYYAIIGQAEAVNQTVSLRHISRGDLGQMSFSELIRTIKNENDLINSWRKSYKKICN